MSAAEKETRGKLIEQVKKAREEMRKLIDEKRRINDAMAKLREDLKKKTGEVQDAKDKLPFRTIPEMENRVRQLEAQIESGQFKLAEEKQILQEISKLKKMRKAFDSLEGGSSDVGSMRLRLDKYRGQVAEKDELINTIKAKCDEFNKKLDEMSGAKAEVQAARADRNAKIDTLKKELDRLYQERRAAYEEYRAAKKAQFEAREKREARRVEYERRRELEDKLEDLKEKLLAFNPETVTDKKIKECNNLIAFFSEILAGSGAHTENKAKVEKVTEGVRQVELSSELKDAEVIKKDDDDVFFVTPSNKKKQSTMASKVNNGSAGSAPISLTKRTPYHIISGLADLGLPIPTTTEDIPSLFKAIEKKRQGLLNKQDDSAAEMEKQHEALQMQITELEKELAKPVKVEKKNHDTEKSAPIEADNASH